MCGGKRGVGNGLNLGGVADFSPSGEVPGVGKTAALLRFDRLDFAVPSLEEDARPAGLIDEGETAAVGAKAGVGSDELGFLHFQEGGDGGDLLLRDFHVSRPAAAVGATFTEISGSFRCFSCVHRVNLACGMKRG